MTVASVEVNHEVTRLADQLDRSFHGGAWHGPAVTEALVGVDGATAFRRSLASAHTIAEVVGHVAFWLDGARRRIDGEALTGLAPEADWPEIPADVDPEACWRGVVENLEEAHRRLHASVRELTDRCLEQAVAGSDPTLRGLLFGLLQHNAYHAGQIVLLRKAAEAAAGRSPSGVVR